MSVSKLKKVKKMKNLAPQIYRQRLVIEGTVKSVISSSSLKEYLNTLSEKIGMITVMPAITHRSEAYGEAGWIHWETSGAHFYAWDDPALFFSVDIYTCKEFNVETAVDFTKDFFDPTEIVYKSF